MVFTLDDLNELNRLIFRTGESVMNARWDGEPSDIYYAQMTRDCDSLDTWARNLRDRIAHEIGAVFDSDHEKFVIIG